MPPTSADGERRRALAEALGRIRHHTASKLPNQRAPAQLLVAIETSIDESSARKNTEDGIDTLDIDAAGPSNGKPPRKRTQVASTTAYLMALLSTLARASSQALTSSAGDSLVASSLYLLTLVTPHVAPGVLRAQLGALIEPLGQVLAAEFKSDVQSGDGQAALVRSALGVLEPLLAALAVDRATLSSDLPLRGCWNATLRLCLDARPKVRKRAQDLVQHILQEEPGTKAHPYAAKTAEWAISALESVSAAGSVGHKTGKNAAPAYDVKSGRAKQPEVAAAARQKTIDGGSANSGIWICGFLVQLAPALPGKSIAPLCATLLRLIGQRNPFLSKAAFEVFESLFRLGRPGGAGSGTLSTLSLNGSASAGVASRNLNSDALETTLDALCSSSVQPSASDVQLIVPYLRALENAMVAYSRIDNGKLAWERVPAVWNSIVALALSSQSKASRTTVAVRIAGREALSALARYCIPDAAVEEAVERRTQSPAPRLVELLGFFDEALSKNTLRYSHAWPEITGVLTALTLRLRLRPVGKRAAATKRVRPAAAHLLMAHVKTVGALRSQPKFENREQVDAVISAAVQVCGPATVLDALPLGLLGENGKEGGRAWLLPLMRSSITNTELAYFVKTLVPLSEKLFNKQAEAEEHTEEGKPKAPIQAKVYEALTEQVWALLPGFCDLPIDLIKSLDTQFAELLANVLYSQPMLRPSVCRALQLLVERSTSLSKSAAPAEMLEDSFGLQADDGKKYLAHLAALAPNLLAVLFNIFSQSPGESRGYLSDCMTAYLGILPQDEIGRTYEKIVTTFENALPTMEPAKDRETGPKTIPPVPHTMLDLLILIVPFTTIKEAKLVFDLGTEDRLLAARDAGLQKKTYRLLARLMEGSMARSVLEVKPDSAGKLPELLSKLQTTGKSVVAGAKRDRTSLLASIVPLIPSSQLHVLPSLVPEAVLATKEVNQGARELAYSLLVQMGRKMEAGGQINRGLVDGAEATDDDEDMQGDGSSVSANLNEYITMVSAGLAGSSPHMISATITALARLLYEFHTELPLETQSELVATMDVFLESANREVVKSTLGFVKVAIVSLPGSVLEPCLSGTVPSLFSSNSRHKMHFKAKIRHIFERLLRRFGYERIESLVDDDNRKLLVNIRKRKERTRRKRAAQDEEGLGDDEDDEAEGVGAGQRAPKDFGTDAFEDAIYGSDSDLSESSSDEEDAKADSKRSGRRARKADAAEQDYLLADDDAPLDLLDRANAVEGRVTMPAGRSAPGSRKRRPGQDAAYFELDEETGRMLIEDPDEPDTDEEEAQQVDVEGAGRAYLDRERGTHGFTTKDGQVRLNKNSKRNREADAEMDEEQMAIEDRLADMVAKQQLQQPVQQANGRAVAGDARAKKSQGKPERKTIGEQFRAKKAGGDIKRGDQSPYAYVPLGDVGAKGRRGKGGRSDVRFLGKSNKRQRS